MACDAVKVEVFDDGRKLVMDDFEGVITIDLVHHEIHEGNHYSATSIATTAIADNGRIGFYISTPADKKAHAIFIAGAGGDCFFHLFSGCTTTAKGTQITAYNWNRASSKTSGTSVWHSPKIGAKSGTTIFQSYLPGGVKNSAVGASAQGRYEFILAPSTKYYMTLDNKAGGAKLMSLGLDWYEESI